MDLLKWSVNYADISLITLGPGFVVCKEKKLVMRLVTVLLKIQCKIQILICAISALQYKYCVSKRCVIV